MAGPNEELVRRAFEVINRSESVDAVMAGLEEQMHPDIELVKIRDRRGDAQRVRWDADSL